MMRRDEKWKMIGRGGGEVARRRMKTLLQSES